MVPVFSGHMTHCPHCGEDGGMPKGETIRAAEFFEEAAGDVAMSAQEHIQLLCRNCDAVLGYLAVGAASGG